MHHGHDLAQILGCCIVRRVKDEMLVRCGGDVAAGVVPAPAFDYMDQAAALAGILNLRVRQDVSLEGVGQLHHWVRPAPGKLPNGNSAVAPNRSLQLSTRLPHTSAASVPTT